MTPLRLATLVGSIAMIVAVAAYELRHPAQCSEVTSIRIANMVMGGC